ncbi:MAG: DNA alkylation repair protein [Piscinibacter sp.]|uniref:DNA alkylation repair protein n=1 Tax=Piscinibacter sp. TaxID=1903157 RepID=UPI002584D814|nr:DNA alkylation repair protein [Piscinibacter sp.]MCW5662403.1 DNA alkylation repair protein [Piscinibacter sp.]
MAEPFKNLIHVGTVDAAARHLQRHGAAFDAARFRRLASQGLEALEFKARAQHLATALEATLPADFAAACDMIEAALTPVRGDEELADLHARDDGLAGWVVWPLTEFVARRGLGEPERALAALHALTQRFSAEWAIRPFIERHPALAFETLARWSRDPSAHVRRLVSEGSRPRLPWGLQLRGLIADPSPTLPLLEALQDDPSEYVRRSVANHLNDIAKDHPGLVADWLERHLPGAPPARRALLRHASRTLIKRGDARVLKAWGLGKPFAGEAALRITPRRLVLGGSLTLALELRSIARRTQTLVIDYAVHHVKASGATAPKVFKGWNLSLAPGEALTLTKRHAVKPITTRRYHAGRHAVDVRINGAVCAEAFFDLKV